MPITINGRKYYRTLEVCREADISRPTLLRWMDKGVIPEPARDRRGWRIFSNDDVKNIIKETGKTR